MTPPLQETPFELAKASVNSRVHSNLAQLSHGVARKKAEEKQGKITKEQAAKVCKDLAD